MNAQGFGPGSGQGRGRGSGFGRGGQGMVRPAGTDTQTQGKTTAEQSPEADGQPERPVGSGMGRRGGGCGLRLRRRDGSCTNR